MLCMYIVCALREREREREGLYLWVSYIMMHMCKGIYGDPFIGFGDDPVVLIFHFAGEGFGFCSFVWMDVDIIFLAKYIILFLTNSIFSLPLPLPLNTFQKYTHTQFERHVNQHKHTFVNIVKRNQLDNL